MTQKEAYEIVFPGNSEFKVGDLRAFLNQFDDEEAIQFWCGISVDNTKRTEPKILEPRLTVVTDSPVLKNPPREINHVGFDGKETVLVARTVLIQPLVITDFHG